MSIIKLARMKPQGGLAQLRQTESAKKQSDRQNELARSVVSDVVRLGERLTQADESEWDHSPKDRSRVTASRTLGMRKQSLSVLGQLIEDLTYTFVRSKPENPLTLMDRGQAELDPKTGEIKNFEAESSDYNRALGDRYNSRGSEMPYLNGFYGSRTQPNDVVYVRHTHYSMSVAEDGSKIYTRSMNNPANKVDQCDDILREKVVERNGVLQYSSEIEKRPNRSHIVPVEGEFRGTNMNYHITHHEHRPIESNLEAVSAQPQALSVADASQLVELSQKKPEESAPGVMAWGLRNPDHLELAMQKATNFDPVEADSPATALGFQKAMKRVEKSIASEVDPSARQNMRLGAASVAADVGLKSLDQNQVGQSAWKLFQTFAPLQKEEPEAAKLAMAAGADTLLALNDRCGSQESRVAALEAMEKSAPEDPVSVLLSLSSLASQKS